jgi:hypothetical protein
MGDLGLSKEEAYAKKISTWTLSQVEEHNKNISLRKGKRFLWGKRICILITLTSIAAAFYIKLFTPIIAIFLLCPSTFTAIDEMNNLEELLIDLPELKSKYPQFF